MRKHLDNLRAKHPAVRSRVAITAAGAVTMIAALVWLTTLPVRFGGNGGEVNTNMTASALEGAQAAANQQAEAQSAAEKAAGLNVVETPPTLDGGAQTTVPSDEYPQAEY